MDTEEPSLTPLRRLLLASACVVAAGLPLAGWSWLMTHSADIWPDISFFFMPAIIGALTGWAARLCTDEGTFGIAGFASAVALVASLAGIILQSNATIDYRLRKIANLAYRENLGYAKATIPNIQDDARLLKAMTGSEVAVIGRLATAPTTAPGLDYWQKRTVLHVHWIMSRMTVSYNQGGRDRSIFEATHILPEIPFLDDPVAQLSKEPVPESDLDRFRHLEAQHLEEMLSGKISQAQYENFLIELVRSRLSLNSVIFHGITPLLGICTAAGVFAAFVISRRHSEVSEI